MCPATLTPTPLPLYSWPPQMYEEGLVRLYTLLGMDAAAARLKRDALVAAMGTEKALADAGAGKWASAAHRLARLSLLTRFGLGRRRTLDQLVAFTGIDLRGQVSEGPRPYTHPRSIHSPFCSACDLSRQRMLGDRCKELHWVPFDPDR